MEVSPQQIEFKGDFSSPNTTQLKLSNTSSKPLAFKVKTNAPKVYSVKPNIQVVKPGDSASVSITLPALKYQLPKNYKTKHKFLIVSVPCPELQDHNNVHEFWSELESKGKENLKSTKVRVNYVVKGGKAEAGAGARLNGTSKRISKFAPQANGSANGTAQEAAVIGAAAASGKAAGALNASNSREAPKPYEDEEPDYVQQQSPSYRRTSYANRQTSGYSAYDDYPAQTAPGKDYSKDIEQLTSQTEKVGKKLENIEKLLIVALMLLSFIIGRSMV